MSNHGTVCSKIGSVRTECKSVLMNVLCYALLTEDISVYKQKNMTLTQGKHVSKFGGISPHQCSASWY